MRKVAVLFVLLCLVSCGKELPDVPENVLPEEPPQTAPPEDLPPSAVPVEEAPPAVEIISDGQEDGMDILVITPRPALWEGMTPVFQKHGATLRMADAMESVIAALAGWLILKEVMTGWELVGCGLVFIAVIISQLPEKSAKKEVSFAGNLFFCCEN